MSREATTYRTIPRPSIPPLVFFDTSKQQSRLVREGSKCVIELEDKASGNVKRYVVTGTNVGVDPGYKEHTGIVHIGDRKNWLYSKRLFFDEREVQRQIELRLDS